MDFFLYVCVQEWIYLCLDCVEHAFFPIDKFWCAQTHCNCNRRYGMNDGRWYRSYIMETLMHKSHKSKMFEFNGFVINCWILVMTFCSLIWTLPHVRFTAIRNSQWWFLARESGSDNEKFFKETGYFVCSNSVLWNLLHSNSRISAAS